MSDVSNISGAVGRRIQLNQQGQTTAFKLQELLDEAKSDPNVDRARANMEFRVKQDASGNKFLELREQTFFGRFKEALGIRSADRNRERQEAMEIINKAVPELKLGAGGNGNQVSRAQARAAVEALDQRLSPDSAGVIGGNSFVVEDTLQGLIAGGPLNDEQFAELAEQNALLGIARNDARSPTQSDKGVSFIGQALSDIDGFEITEALDDLRTSNEAQFGALQLASKDADWKGVLAGFESSLKNIESLKQNSNLTDGYRAELKEREIEAKAGMGRALEKLDRKAEAKPILEDALQLQDEAYGLPTKEKPVNGFVREAVYALFACTSDGTRMGELANKYFPN